MVVISNVLSYALKTPAVCVLGKKHQICGWVENNEHDWKATRWFCFCASMKKVNVKGSSMKMIPFFTDRMITCISQLSWNNKLLCNWLKLNISLSTKGDLLRLQLNWTQRWLRQNCIQNLKIDWQKTDKQVIMCCTVIRIRKCFSTITRFTHVAILDYY